MNIWNWNLRKNEEVHRRWRWIWFKRKRGCYCDCLIINLNEWRKKRENWQINVKLCGESCDKFLRDFCNLIILFRNDKWKIKTKISIGKFNGERGFYLSWKWLWCVADLCILSSWKVPFTLHRISLTNGCLALKKQSVHRLLIRDFRLQFSNTRYSISSPWRSKSTKFDEFNQFCSKNQNRSIPFGLIST